VKVLIVDDERNLRLSLAQYLEYEGIEALLAESAEAGQEILRRESLNAVVLDLRLPGMDGLGFLEWMRGLGFSIPVVMISAHGDVKDAVRAMKLGAQDYLVKPFDPEELVIRLGKAAEEAGARGRDEARRLDEARRRDPANPADSALWGESEAIRKVRELVAKVAPTNSTVLITGETGTGKEVAAREIHRLSARAGAAFVPVNLGGISETLIESELFGHEKGAFTGADSRRIGYFEIASGGTIFLDEVGELPAQLQVKLLRVLQERRITRLGSSTTFPIDIRVIAATNRNIEDEVKRGSFREDLFYRLDVFRITLPPLRERGADTLILARRFLDLLGRQMGRRLKGFSPEAESALRGYPFPGNVRELENYVERALILSEGPYADIELPALKERDDADIGGGSLRSAERDAIRAALLRNGGHREKTARELGISRRSLFNKMREFGLLSTKGDE
jgi:DNA-binding NtrC family response regulator